MATVTVYTAARMQAIEDNAVVSGTVVGDDLILTKHNGVTIDAGNVRGPVGPQGPEDVNSVKLTGDQTIDGVKSFLQVVNAPYISLSAGPTGYSPIYTNAPVGLTAQIVNLQKNSVTMFQVDKDGKVAASGADHFLGQHTFGGAGATLHIVAPNDTYVALAAENSGAYADFYMKTKGSGKFYWQNDVPTTFMSLDSTAKLSVTGDVLAQNGSGNQVRIGVVGSGTAAGLEFGSSADFLGKIAAGRIGLYIGSTEVVDVQANSFQAFGTDNYFGPSAGPRIHLAADTGNTFWAAEGTTADIGVVFRQKGVGDFYFQTAVGATIGQVVHTGDGYWGGSTHIFGNNAFGGAGSRIHIIADTDTSIAKIDAESSATSTNLAIRTKGAASSIFLQPGSANGTGAGYVQINNDGGLWAKGTISRFGEYAFTAANTELQIGTGGLTTAALIFATGAPTNVDLVIKNKAGTFYFDNNSGNVAYVNSTSTGWYAPNHYFGANAGGGSGTRIALGSMGDANSAFVIAQSSAADCNLVFKQKGAFGFFFQTDAGATLLNIDANGHVLTGGGAPTGTASTPYTTCTINGTDVSGTVNLTGGGGGSHTAGTVVATITFANAFPNTPHVIVTCSGAEAASMGTPSVGASSTGFTITGPLGATGLNTAQYHYAVFY